jgi:uncharacterized protein (DUF302 family)
MAAMVGIRSVELYGQRRGLVDLRQSKDPATGAVWGILNGLPAAAKENPMKSVSFPVVALVGLAVAGLSAGARAADNPAFWKHQAKGDFAKVVAHVKQGLEAAQFQITQEENLSKGLENNKHLFPAGKWNSIGFDNVTAVHFCSVVFNQEAFNIELDWSILCPFKLVAYTTKKAPKDVNLVMIKPTYVMEKDKHAKAREIGKKIEERIVAAIQEGLAHPR